MICGFFIAEIGVAMFFPYRCFGNVRRNLRGMFQKSAERNINLVFCTIRYLLMTLRKDNYSRCMVASQPASAVKKPVTP
jgi:hypothetical protein